jgi:2-oxoglutarate ferredoxin oxidoreductase subunit beta
MLSELQPPDFPMAIGVLYDSPSPSYERELYAQIEEERGKTKADFNALLHGAHTWRVE